MVDSDVSREVVLHVHLPATALSGVAGTADASVRGGHPFAVDVEAVRRWCGSDATSRVLVRPVVDLASEITVPGYVPTERLREQVLARHPRCVFPDCQRPSRRCDLDHVIAYDADGPPGQTTTSNLAPLCRWHHRLKTHGRWRHRPVAGGFEWTGPHGRRRTVLGPIPPSAPAACTPLDEDPTPF